MRFPERNEPKGNDEFIFCGECDSNRGVVIREMRFVSNTNMVRIHLECVDCKANYIINALDSMPLETETINE